MADELTITTVVVNANTDVFVEQMDDVTESLAKVGESMKNVGDTIVGVMTNTINKWSVAGEEIHNFALRTGFSTEALSEWRYMMELSGGSLSTIESATRNMQLAFAGAQEGVETNIEAFNKLGLQYQSLQGISPEEQFNQIIGALASLEDTTLQAKLAEELFGSAGADMLPIISQGKDGIAAMRQEAHNLGIVFDQEAVDKATSFRESVTDLKSSLFGLGNVISKSVSETFEDLIDIITEIVTKITEWMDAHPGLAEAIGVAGFALGIVLIALGGLLALLPGLTIATGAFGFTLNSALLPITLIALAIAALITICVLLITHWDEIKAKAIEIWNNIKEFFTDLWTSIKEKAIEIWNSIKEFFTGIWDGIKEKASGIWDNIAEKFKNVWQGIKDFFVNIWNNIVGFFEGTINNIIKGINIVIGWINKIPGLEFGEVSSVKFEASQYATGGIVPGPIGRPRLAIVHGGETIIPAGGGGGSAVTNNFNISSLVVREEADIQRIARELYRIQRTKVALHGA